MNLLEKIEQDSGLFSLEFFPPKKDMPVSSVYSAIESLSQLGPAFVSVTYGAGGSGRDRTIDIVSHVKETYALEAIAHLTCVGADPQAIDAVLAVLEARGIRNVLALRGDIPADMDRRQAFAHYRYASDLISEIKNRSGYTIAAAAYPEAHVESASLEDDIANLKRKADAGADFFITQLCFDRSAITGFFEQLEKARIRVPTLVGIMPILDPKQIIRMSLLSACSIPAPLSKIICRYGEDPDAFAQAGLDYAVAQIDYLKSAGIRKFHLYTMNKAEAVRRVIADSGLARPGASD